jgi:hypothetical protein
VRNKRVDEEEGMSTYGLMSPENPVKYLPSCRSANFASHTPAQEGKGETEVRIHYIAIVLGTVAAVKCARG